MSRLSAKAACSDPIGMLSRRGIGNGTSPVDITANGVFSTLTFEVTDDAYPTDQVNIAIESA